MGSLPKEFVDELCADIVGFEIKVARLEGKLKLSQNREPMDRRRVFDQLSASESTEDRAVAEWMKRIYGY
jgi:transcriptional regulator